MGVEVMISEFQCRNFIILFGVGCIYIFMLAIFNVTRAKPANFRMTEAALYYVSL